MGDLVDRGGAALIPRQICFALILVGAALCRASCHAMSCPEHAAAGPDVWDVRRASTALMECNCFPDTGRIPDTSASPARGSGRPLIA